jgi:hypothetical protein
MNHIFKIIDPKPESTPVGGKHVPLLAAKGKGKQAQITAARNKYQRLMIPDLEVYKQTKSGWELVETVKGNYPAK